MRTFNYYGLVINRKTVSSFMCAFLIGGMGLLSSCSSDDNKKENEPEDPKEEVSKPYSYTVTESNKNMPTAGTLIFEFSDSPTSNTISKLVDQNTNSKFITGHNSFYIEWVGNMNICLNRYSISSADDLSEKDPKSWELFGSNNKSSWTSLDVRTNEKFESRKQTKEYQVSDKTNYRYFKIQFNDNNGGKGTQFSELFFSGYPTDMQDLINSYAEGYSNNNQTPMGNHYANKHVTTDSDREWLLNPENEPDAPSHVSSLKWTKFNVILYPFGKPVPADVNQHSIGDCSALAVFASFAYIYPDFIKSIISTEDSESFIVKMFDPQGEPVEVAVTSKFLADDNGNIQAASGKYNKATWATVLEKAIIKWNMIYKVNTDIGGIGSEHVAPLFTGNGNSFAFYPGKLTSSQMKRAVLVSLVQGKVIVGGFNKGGLDAGGGESVTGHAFTLMHSTESAALFTMRNPWGGDKDGILNIPDNGIVQPTIDLRIIEPGIAAEYASGAFDPYIPPVFSANENKVRISEYLLNTGK